jgi:site-specific DNA-adenine methylase
MVKMSFSQLGRNFARATSGRAQHPGLIARSLELFPVVNSVFQKIQVENLDAIQCLRDFDSSDTVHYVDPDYIGATSGIYQHTVNHKRLLETIHDLKGFVALSGYDNDLYNSYKWDDKLTWEVPVTACAQAFTESNHLKGKEDQMRRGTATEVLWIKT